MEETITKNQLYSNKYIKRFNFTFRNKYDYYLYCKIEEICRRDGLVSKNNLVKQAVKYDRGNPLFIDYVDLYKPFPSNYKYSKQFTVSVNKKTEKELYNYICMIERKMPISDYIRNAVYKYIVNQSM